MFHFTPRRIEAHVCICFVALKVYKELERLLKRSGCPYSVDEVLKIAETVVTIEIARPENNDTVTKTLCLTEEERARLRSRLPEISFSGMGYVRRAS